MASYQGVEHNAPTIQEAVGGLLKKVLPADRYSLLNIELSQTGKFVVVGPSDAGSGMSPVLDGAVGAYAMLVGFREDTEVFVDSEGDSIEAIQLPGETPHGDYFGAGMGHDAADWLDEFLDEDQIAFWVTGK